jgi:dienelactone hydrolase
MRDARCGKRAAMATTFTRRGAITLLVVAVLIAGREASAQSFRQDMLRIPMASAGPRGLEAMLVRPNEPGPFPLVLISHGSPRAAEQRPKMTPLALEPMAIEFARRGWAAAVVMRRGYGDSGGGWAESFKGCANPDYAGAEAAAVADLRASIDFLSKQPTIDGTRIMAVGVSAGGMASVALTADPPKGLSKGLSNGLLAAISFAGGRGSVAADQQCGADRLINLFRRYGERSRVPMLWVYAENDQFFGPALADKFRQAFTSGGGLVTFVRPPAFGADGHKLFSALGIPLWTPLVDDFLRSRNLVLRETLLPSPHADLQAPAGLSAKGRDAFAAYLVSADHKAFAMSPHGNSGWRTAQRSIDDAKAGALSNCRKFASDCRLIAVDDTAIP